MKEATIPSEKVKLLKNDIQHIWNRRIHEGGSLPKDVAHSVKQNVFSKDSQVFPGNVSRNQVMIKTGEKYPNMSAITKDNAFNGVSIRSAMKKDLSTLLRKYPDLKQLLLLLETVDEYTIDLISQDFLQIILARYKDEFDISIKNMNDNPPPRYNRWYDNNYNLHTCIEFIKTLEDNEKTELINAFIMSLLSFITNVDDE